MNKEKINDYLQNRNVVMFVTSLFFMLGIFAYFSQKEILIACVSMLILVLLLAFSLIGVKKSFIYRICILYRVCAHNVQGQNFR